MSKAGTGRDGRSGRNGRNGRFIEPQDIYDEVKAFQERLK